MVEFKKLWDQRNIPKFTEAEANLAPVIWTELRCVASNGSEAAISDAYYAIWCALLHSSAYRLPGAEGAAREILDEATRWIKPTIPGISQEDFLNYVCGLMMRVKQYYCDHPRLFPEEGG